MAADPLAQSMLELAAEDEEQLFSEVKHKISEVTQKLGGRSFAFFAVYDGWLLSLF